MGCTNRLTQTIDRGNSHGRPRELREGPGVVPICDHVPVRLMRRSDRLNDFQQQQSIDCRGIVDLESLELEEDTHQLHG